MTSTRAFVSLAHCCMFRCQELATGAMALFLLHNPLLQRPDEEPGFGLAGHLISLLLQASAASPVFWQRHKEPLDICKDKCKGSSEKENANDSRGKEKEKYRTGEVNKLSREPAAVVAGLQSSIWFAVFHQWIHLEDALAPANTFIWSEHNETGKVYFLFRLFRLELSTYK